MNTFQKSTSPFIFRYVHFFAMIDLFLNFVSLPPAYEVLREVMFSDCLSVHKGDGGGVPPGLWSLPWSLVSSRPRERDRVTRQNMGPPHGLDGTPLAVMQEDFLVLLLFFLICNPMKRSSLLNGKKLIRSIIPDDWFANILEPE